ncbi:MAG: TlpA disulfide reductase family protein [Arachidicoccus sp.]|nr:TlpA disulfide reductase family protein [Arachidicoccus sp.]
MKKLLSCIIFLNAIVFTSCNSTSSNGRFTVTGKVTDKSSSIQGKYIFLKEVSITDKEPVIIDSQKVSAGGAFTLKSNIAGQHLFIVTINGGFPFLLINDNNEITYNINGSDPLHPDIKGSDATTKLYQFINDYKLKDSVLTNTAIELDSMNKLPTTTHQQDSIMEVLVDKKKAEITEINTFIKNFIGEGDNPVAIFYVLNVMAPRTFEPKELLPLAQAASVRFKDDGSLAAFASRVKEAVSGDENATDNYPLLNKAAPDLAMTSPDGLPVKISDFKGKYLLVDFWASWCGPCRAENPNVVKVYNKFRDKNFTILGVSLDQDKDAWAKAIKNDKLTWNHMSDLKQWESAAVQAYHFDGIPFNVLIDPLGKIIADNLRGEDLDKKLDQIFNPSATTPANDSAKTQKS